MGRMSGFVRGSGAQKIIVKLEAHIHILFEKNLIRMTESWDWLTFTKPG